MPSPYEGIPKEEWAKKTTELIEKLPLTKDEIVDVVLSSWKQIMASSFGNKSYRIGKDILPSPQVMGSLLHAMIPLELASKKPGKWRVDAAKHEKDLVCVQDTSLSIEIKTSSHKDKIAGNRSYSQEQAATKDKPKSDKPQKEKSGYYLTVNFEKFTVEATTKKINKPQITQISLGWIDHADWRGQAAATGQSASISPDVYKSKLKQLYLNGKKL